MTPLVTAVAHWRGPRQAPWRTTSEARSTRGCSSTRGRRDRSCIALTALGVVTALLIIAQALLLADVISSAFSAAKDLAQLRTPLAALLLVVLARGAVAWGRELLAARSSARAKSQLRRRCSSTSPRSARAARATSEPGELAVLATRGIDALDAYFSLYLPQLALAVIVPLAVIAVIADRDWISALIIAGTLPLIPVFMALVGATTRDRMELQLRTLQQLAGHFLDVVAGPADAEGVRAREGADPRRSARSPIVIAARRCRRCESRSCPR